MIFLGMKIPIYNGAWFSSQKKRIFVKIWKLKKGDPC